jgi:Tol biopolymer transport system component/DNA-binding winged helix-turn-helix (wHTH) protein
MNRSDTRFHHFGNFRVDVVDRRLFHSDEEVPLPPKVFETLLLLLEKPGQLVGKDELMDRLWPGTFVGEDTLAQKISLLRKALNGGNGSEGYISTVPKLGYRFTGEVRLGIRGTDGIQEATESIQDVASTANVVPEVGTRSRLLIIGIVVTAIILGVGAVWLVARRSSAFSAANYRIRNLDVSNPLVYGVISPDGKFLAYVRDGNGTESLWVRPVASAGKGLQILPEIAGAIWGVTYSPDLEYLYYVFSERSSGVGILYRVNSLGGVPQRLLQGIDGAVSFQPGGQRMVYKRYASLTQRDVVELVTVRADGTDARMIARSDVRYAFFNYIWTSEDRIAYSEGIQTPGGIDWYVAEIPASGGPESKIVGPHSTTIKIIQELNRSEFGALATDPQTGLAQLWLFNRSGDIRRVTNDTNHYTNLTLAPAARRMLATHTESEDSLWVIDVANLLGGRTQTPIARQLNLPPGGYNQPVWTPDGDIVYVALSGGDANELWWMKSDGTGQRRLISNGADNRHEEVSPDGKFIVYVVDRNGSGSIWRIDIDGSNPLKLTDGGADHAPTVSPDGNWVVYNASVGGRWGVWKVPSHGGTAVKIGDSSFTSPRISPDGKLLTFEHETSANHELRWGIFRLEDGSLLRDVKLEKDYELVFWSSDDKSLIYYSNYSRPQILWIQPITGQSSKMLIDLGSTDVPHLDLSHDGKKILMVRRNSKTDLALLEGMN